MKTLVGLTIAVLLGVLIGLSLNNNRINVIAQGNGAGNLASHHQHFSFSLLAGESRPVDFFPLTGNVIRYNIQATKNGARRIYLSGEMLINPTNGDIVEAVSFAGNDGETMIDNDNPENTAFTMTNISSDTIHYSVTMWY